ncbi:hypothetical protein KKE45_03095 [Patescibacteria group bacterium]|nr:hypothetical protein [Patescibacteria group bacterium]
MIVNINKVSWYNSLDQMKQVTFITGNKDKWNTAKKVLLEYEIDLLQKKIDTPEIQSMDVREIATYSAKFAVKKIKAPVIKTDVGYYINALNGFPGPFVKYLNQCLLPTDVVNLVKNHTDKSITLKECIAYCEPRKKPIIFISETYGAIATKPQGKGSTMDQILIIKGFNKPQGACKYEKVLAFWSKKLSHYHQLGKYLQG